MSDIIVVENFLNNGRYDLVCSWCNNTTKENIKNVFMNMAYKYCDINCIMFVEYMVNKNRGDSFWLELIIEMLLNPYSHLEGAYSSALFFTRELIRTDESVENMEIMFFLNKVPDLNLDKNELIMLSKKILKIEPDNKNVKKFLNEL